MLFLLASTFINPLKSVFMAPSGKLSAKRSKPSYFMSILGVTLVLFIVGVLGWVVLNSRNLEQVLRESATMNVFINQTTTEKDKDSLVVFVQNHPFVKSYKYIDKDEAKKEWLSQGNEDFNVFIDNMMLPRSVDVNFKSDFADSAHMASFKAELGKFAFVNDVKFPKEVVAKFSLLRKVTVGLGIIALVLLALTVVLIDNTIRLAMFSNRFLIKTMQMVGATRWFIAKPMNIRAIINGAISGTLAIVAMVIVIFSIENWVPEMKGLRNGNTMLLLCSVILLIGISITLVSTHRSIIKYLKMKLDDLY
ncbi:MAG: permease-like cell division protein FtsX [Chitinophagaceae bacterium]|jgi:cell division transport system permease protein|uniref:cell division protein FtsX n=2 Tax=unclassified Paraflavitalea TaxID=2798305 RepID=UPI003D341519|nr:permease-like cell division protein FtsX [Chitinophagaceae bacterium]